MQYLSQVTGIGEIDAKFVLLNLDMLLLVKYPGNVL